MKKINVNWFFENSPILFCVPLLIVALAVFVTFLFPTPTKTFMTIIVIGWAYANLFLILDLLLSVIFGRSGDTLKYFMIYGEHGPDVAFRGHKYITGNFVPRIVGKVGLIFILGALPLFAVTFN